MKGLKAIGIVALIALVGFGLIWIARSPAGAARYPALEEHADREPLQKMSADVPDRLPGLATSSPITSVNWQKVLEDPKGLVDVFGAAVKAAESGDIDALREIHDFVVLCATKFDYARSGGSSEYHIGAQFLPPGGRAQVEADYIRCAAIATAPQFATWSLVDGKLNGQYWERVGERLDDPLFTSFRIGERVMQATYVVGKGKEALKKEIAPEVQRVLRSGDGTAWFDFGSRALSGEITSDPSIGLALILVGCERGYDCSNANRHNMSLNCNLNPNCGAATSFEELYRQRFPAEVNARARTRYLELQAMIEQGEWDRIEHYVPLDGSLFK